MSYRKLFIRNKDHSPRGVMLTMEVDGKLCAGWSLCNENDPFDKKLGTMIAENRARNGSNKDIPHSIKAKYDAFVQRSVEHFVSK